MRHRRARPRVTFGALTVEDAMRVVEAISVQAVFGNHRTLKQHAAAIPEGHIH